MFVSIIMFAEFAFICFVLNFRSMVGFHYFTRFSLRKLKERKMGTGSNARVQVLLYLCSQYYMYHTKKQCYSYDE